MGKLQLKGGKLLVDSAGKPRVGDTCCCTGGKCPVPADDFVWPRRTLHQISGSSSNVGSSTSSGHSDSMGMQTYYTESSSGGGATASYNASFIAEMYCDWGTPVTFGHDQAFSYAAWQPPTKYITGCTIAQGTKSFYEVEQKSSLFQVYIGFVLESVAGTPRTWKLTGRWGDGGSDWTTFMTYTTDVFQSTTFTCSFKSALEFTLTLDPVVLSAPTANNMLDAGTYSVRIPSTASTVSVSCDGGLTPVGMYVRAVESGRVSAGGDLCPLVNVTISLFEITGLKGAASGVRTSFTCPAFRVTALEMDVVINHYRLHLRFSADLFPSATEYATPSLGPQVNRIISKTVTGNINHADWTVTSEQGYLPPYNMIMSHIDYTGSCVGSISDDPCVSATFDEYKGSYGFGVQPFKVLSTERYAWSGQYQTPGAVTYESREIPDNPGMYGFWLTSGTWPDGADAEYQHGSMAFNLTGCGNNAADSCAPTGPVSQYAYVWPPEACDCNVTPSYFPGIGNCGQVGGVSVRTYIGKTLVASGDDPSSGSIEHSEYMGASHTCDDYAYYSPSYTNRVGTAYERSVTNMEVLGTTFHKGNSGWTIPSKFRVIDFNCDTQETIDQCLGGANTSGTQMSWCTQTWDSAMTWNLTCSVTEAP